MSKQEERLREWKKRSTTPDARKLKPALDHIAWAPRIEDSEEEVAAVAFRRYDISAEQAVAFGVLDARTGMTTDEILRCLKERENDTRT